MIISAHDYCPPPYSFEFGFLSEHVDEPWAFAAYCSNLVKDDGHLGKRLCNLLLWWQIDFEIFLSSAKLLKIRSVVFGVEILKIITHSL